MIKVVVTNPNILIDAPNGLTGAAGRSARIALRRQQLDARPADADLLRQITEVRRRVDALVCSSTWGEDCLYRGAHYLPDFKCGCPACREKFSDRRHPRAARESNLSIDCQVESDDDAELAEDLAKLRNDRPRVGSVFLRVVRTLRDGD